MDRDVEYLLAQFDDHVGDVTGPSVFSYAMSLTTATGGYGIFMGPMEVNFILLETAYRRFMKERCPYEVCFYYPINHDDTVRRFMSTGRELIGWISEPDHINVHYTRYFFSNDTDACFFKLSFG